MTGVVVCADVGSTFTKVAAVDLATGALLATAEHRTTVESDVLRGLDAAIGAVVAQAPGADTETTYACSSAGGGLRLAVIGYEELVTAEAGHRVGLSAGARVVHVGAGRLDRTGVAALRAARPDVVLLVGGTDGGDAEVLVHNARALAAARLRLPVVVAGNADVRDEVLGMLGPRAVGAANVLPRIGELNPYSARAAIRDVFLRHVIGGKRLSRGRRFPSLVRGATPDVVLTAVELLAATIGGDLVVVDVGGATTDVYSVVDPDQEAGGEESASPRRSADVAGTLRCARTVEGDLGVRWNAPSVVETAAREKLLRPGAESSLVDAARVRAEDPAYLPSGVEDLAAELRLAELAATVAVRRHARGRDLRAVRLLVGSGGVLRHQPAEAAALLGRVLTDHAGGWMLPQAARVSVDVDYVLAPAGLLAADHPHVAAALLRRAFPFYSGDLGLRRVDEDQSTRPRPRSAGTMRGDGSSIDGENRVDRP